MDSHQWDKGLCQKAIYKVIKNTERYTMPSDETDMFILFFNLFLTAYIKPPRKSSKSNLIQSLKKFPRMSKEYKMEIEGKICSQT